MNTKNNCRFKETEQLIEQCYLSLLSDGEEDDITVKLLCQKAGINRSTFYAHYEDIFSLRDRILQRFMAELINISSAPDYSSGYIWSKDFFEMYLLHIKNNQGFYLSFLRDYLAVVENSSHIDMFSGYSKNGQILPRNHYGMNDIVLSDAEVRYRFMYHEAGITMCLLRWVKFGCQESIEEICSILTKILD